MNKKIYDELTDVYLDLYIDFEIDSLYRTVSIAAEAEPIDFASIYKKTQELIELLNDMRNRVKKIEGDLYDNNDK